MISFITWTNIEFLIYCRTIVLSDCFNGFTNVDVSEYHHGFQYHCTVTNTVPHVTRNVVVLSQGAHAEVVGVMLSLTYSGD